MEALLLTLGLLAVALSHLAYLMSRPSDKSSPHVQVVNFDLFQQDTYPTQKPTLRMLAKKFLYSFVWSFRVFLINVSGFLKNKSQIPIMGIRQVVASILFGRGILQS